MAKQPAGKKPSTVGFKKVVERKGKMPMGAKGGMCRDCGMTKAKCKC